MSVGLEDLATAVVDGLRVGAQRLHASLVHGVLRSAYLASLGVDEGRHPRFTIHLGPRPDPRTDGITILRYGDAPVTDSTLARLAFSVPPRPFALSLTQAVGGESALVHGILRVEQVGGQLVRRQGLLIDVIAPGHLLVCNAMQYGWGFRLLGGEVNKIADIASNGAVQAACHRATDDMEVPHGDESSEAEEWRESTRGALRLLVYACVARIVSMGHGGALAILPIPLEEVDGLDVGEPARGPSLLNAAQQIAEEVRAGDRGAHIQAYDAARVVAALTQVDGVVIMDGKMQVTAYGCKIHFKDVPSCRRVSEFVTSTEPLYRTLEWPEYSVKERGTRHQSAAWLAAEVPDAVVVVVSQDGAVRVFENAPDGRPFLHESVGGLVGHTPIP